MKDKTIVEISNEMELAGFIKANGTQCRFVSMVSKTPVTKMKVSNPFHTIKSGKVVGPVGLWKVSRKTGIINANYVNSVRNRIAEKLGVSVAQVDYEAGEVYYEHLQTADGKNLPLVQHKDETKRKGLLLQYYPHKSENCYVNAAGEIVPDAEVEKYLHAQSERSEFKPAVIGIYLSNIKRLTASGVVVETGDYDEAAASLADSRTLAEAARD
jgi:hypothetical protein